MDITRGSIQKSDGLYSLQPKMGKLYTVSKTRPGADCGSDHELLMAKFRFQLKKEGKTTSPFRDAAKSAKSLQSCLILCDPIDSSPPGSPVPGLLQARTLERVAIFFSNAWKWKVKGKLLSRVRLLAAPWTAAHQAPPSTAFPRQECWSGLPLPSLIEQYSDRKKMPI